MWYDCEELQYYLRLRAGGGVVNTAVSGTELSTWCWNCPLRCRWSGWNDQLVVGLQMETERESKREANKRQQYLVICISLSNFFFFSKQIQTTWGLPLSYTDCVWFKLDLIRTSSANCHNTFVIVITRRPQMTHGQAEAAQLLLLLAVWGFGFGFSVTTGGESPL